VRPETDNKFCCRAFPYIDSPIRVRAGCPYWPAAFAAEIKENAVINNVVRYFAGEITEAEVIEGVHSSDAQTQAQQLCEAYFYVGMGYLVGANGVPADRSKAEDYFQKCLATNVSGLTEYFLATGELGRLRAR